MKKNNEISFNNTPINEWWYHFCLPVLLLFAVLSATGCNSSGSDGETDNTPPTISIEYPTAGPAFITAESILYIAGSASDNKRVNRVTWETNTSQTGIASGTTSWGAYIPLVIGLNEITFTVEDAAGNTATDILTTTYTNQSFSISGTIAASESVVVDSDVNDTNEVYLSNDTIAEAQEVLNPVTIGGYVNVAGAGETGGRSYSSGDVDDFYRVALETGDEITLVVAEYQTADMELSLYNDADPENPVETILVTGSFASVTAPGSGTFFIRVNINSGASNYTLSVGTAIIGSGSVAAHASESSDLRLSDDFVPGQVIVRFKDEISIQSGAMTVRDRIREKGLLLASRGRTRMALGQMDEGSREKVFKTLGVSSASLSGQPSDARSRRKLDTLRMVKALRRQPDVQYAEPNYYVHSTAEPDDIFYEDQWNLSAINLPEAWEYTTGSSNVVVAVVDTGVLMDHPDLAGQLTNDGYDFISDPDISLDGDGIDSNPDDPGDMMYGTHSSFHGTHCAGIVAAASNNGIGVSGVAWETKIMPIRVLGDGGVGTTYDVLQGVLYAAGLENDSDTVPSQPADVISLSLGGDGGADQYVYNQVRAQGIIVVAAAGNEATNDADEYDYPASYEGVISVSAVDITGDLAPYSNYGALIDVAAPGGSNLAGVISTCGDDRSGSVNYSYSYKSGTSMATPHVAGVAALMKAINGDMTPDEFGTHIQNFDIVTDAGTAGWDEAFGYGIIDAFKAVQVAQYGVAGALLKVTPMAFNLGFSASSITLTTEKIGDATLFNVESFDDGADWLTVVADAVDGQGLGTYTVQVDRTGLADGYYSTTITFTTTIDGQTTQTLVRANMQVNASGTVIPDSGYHYVLLVMADTLETVMVEEVTAENGVYTYSFENVPEGGHYKIFAGTDRDYDTTINNYGECFGVYGSIDQPLEVIVTEDLTGLDFNTELNVSFTADLQSMDIKSSNSTNPTPIPSIN